MHSLVIKVLSSPRELLTEGVREMRLHKTLFLSATATLSLCAVIWLQHQSEQVQLSSFPLYFIICGVFIIGGIQMRISLTRIRASETLLREERDLLEVRVKERTDEVMKEQLERAIAQQRLLEFGKISTGVFHDLSGPLTALLLTIGRMQNSKHAELSPLKVEIDRLNNTSARLGKFMQTVQNSLRNHQTQTDFCITTLVDDICDMLSYRYRESQVKVIKSAHEEAIISGNHLRLQHVITNIINNALDALEDKKDPTIRIITKRKEKRLKLHIIDNGSGMDEKTLAQIFTPFFTTKPAHKGTGIGLSQSKKIIHEEFGGRIEVKSKPGVGTTFTLHLQSK